MIGELWKLLSETVKDRPFVKGALTFFGLFVMAAAAGYEYLQWRYSFSPPLDLYLGSYVFSWITLVFGGGLAVALLYKLIGFVFRPRAAGEEGRRQAIRTLVRQHWRTTLGAVTAITVVLLIAVPLWLR